MNTAQIKKTKKTKKSKNDAIRELFLKTLPADNQRATVTELSQKFPSEFKKAASAYLDNVKIFQSKIAPNELKVVCSVVNETAFKEILEQTLQSYNYTIKNPTVILHAMSYFRGLGNKKELYTFLVNHFTIDEIAAELEYVGGFSGISSSPCYETALELLSKSGTHQAVFDKFSNRFIADLADRYAYDCMRKLRASSSETNIVDHVRHPLQYAILLSYARSYSNARLTGIFLNSEEDLKNAMSKLGRIKSKTLLLNNPRVFLKYVSHDIIETSCLNAKDWILIIKKHYDEIQKNGSFPLTVDSVQHLKNEFLLEVLTGTKHSGHTKKSLTLIDEILETYFKEEQSVE